MSVSPVNRLRWRTILHSREVKAIFHQIPERFAKAVLKRWFVGILMRWLFVKDDGRPHRAGEIVLAYLRDTSRLHRGTIFEPDAMKLSYLEGRRSAVLEIFNLLNLNEADVQQLMRLDDGLE